MKRLISFFVLLAGLMVFSLTGSEAFAAGKVSAVGTLNSVESDGSVVIDKNGYLVNQSAKILNSYGERISLKSFSLPARVCFEYEYTKKGPAIRMIMEYPRAIPK